jgi:hypothetical protein
MDQLFGVGLQAFKLNIEHSQWTYHQSTGIMDSRRHFDTYSRVSEPSVNLAKTSFCDGLRIIFDAFKLMTLGEHLGRCHDPGEQRQDAISIIRYGEMILESLKEDQLRQASIPACKTHRV